MKISISGRNRRALGPCALLLLSPTLSGCGGGGSATPAALVQPAAVTLSGTVQDAAGTALSGYTVVYTPAATATSHARRTQAAAGALSAVTDSRGHYSLAVPTAQITANATLAVYDPGGTQVQSQTLTLDPSRSAQTATVTVPDSTVPAPPTPPSDPTPVGTTPPPPAPPV